MAIGLGMTPEEWTELKSKVDDSFWVMRIIGSSACMRIMVDSIGSYLDLGYPPLPNDYDGFSCGAHRCDAILWVVHFFQP